MTLSPPRQSPLMPGYRLDRYELLAQTAEGGMGQVWVARLVGKHGFEKLVALKTLLPRHASDDKFRTMFLDEARVASAIKHVNVAEILDVGEEREILYLVMEWVDGDALSKIMRLLAKKEQRLPLGVALRVVMDTAAGLHAAHELTGEDGQNLGVVHRDVSPQNILVTSAGVAKLIDFGIAKARGRISQDTSEGVLKGKLNYMAPEQAMSVSVDRRTDVYALGAILYHALAGRPVHDGDSQISTVRLLIEGATPKPLPEEVPSAIAQIVMRALSREPSRRHETAQAFALEVNEAAKSLGIAAEHADVVAFLADKLPERVADRKQALDLALRAATERARFNAMLTQPAVGETSTPGRARDIALLPPPVPTSSSRLPDVPEDQVTITASSHSEIDGTHVDGLPSRGPLARVVVPAVVITALLGLAFALTSLRSSPPPASGSAAASSPAPAPAPAPVPEASSVSASASASASSPVPAPAPPSASASSSKPTRPPPRTGGTTSAPPAPPSSARPRPTGPAVPDFGY